MKDLKQLGKFRMEKENRLWLTIENKNLVKTCEKLKHEYGVRRVISISGYDAGKTIEVIYHLELGHGILNLKTEVSKRTNTVDSIVSVFPSANLFERELAEMLGLRVTGHPNLKKLFLPKEINHPLRKGD